MPITPYNREKAVAYAHRWAYSRNPAYYNFDNLGGDCTNFTSQCIHAGDAVMNYTPEYGWYYININRRTPSWTGVEFLYRFIVNNDGIGPFAERVIVQDIKPGDFVQLRFSGPVFQHSPFVVQVGDPPSTDNILVAAHTFDADYRPLSSYAWEEIRYVHILGVRR